METIRYCDHYEPSCCIIRVLDNCNCDQRQKERKCELNENDQNVKDSSNFRDRDTHLGQRMAGSEQPTKRMSGSKTEIQRVTGKHSAERNSTKDPSRQRGFYVGFKVILPIVQPTSHQNPLHTR